jgi:hypothetical protein
MPDDGTLVENSFTGIETSPNEIVPEPIARGGMELS